ncbi:LysR substrate-binding domain-containing protein [Kiloniella laminariae]|uniref:LysR substrate-binding domain-containing protein n=1 Tax=Kiloniella laminariae TaxID=454162 RepID=A0ABT4LQQ7_9PROT|nr:LysR substrate-binding domain-containing protein [Kiloniella laminariae]MCZ4282267.1 LysR substrate-binding domain-containing protein [Kiloniella laminariae]
MAGRLDATKLPPLKALKGFESAARLESFRGAADELNLTHTAISHQVRLLEESLAVALFVRAGRSVKLTREGEIFYPVVREALGQLLNCAEILRRSGQSRNLRVQAYVTLSIRWLARRLHRFRALETGFDLQIISSILDGSFDESLADIGMIYTAKPLAEHLHWVPLFEARLTTVCSPDFLAAQGGKMVAADLLHLPLLKVYTADDHWNEWFQSAGVTAPSARSSIGVDTVAIALEMAMDGEGVAMVNGPFAEGDIKAGRLVQPVDHVALAPGGWGLACRNDLKDDPRIQVFINWMKDEVARYSSN